MPQAPRSITEPIDPAPEPVPAEYVAAPIVRTVQPRKAIAAGAGGVAGVVAGYIVAKVAHVDDPTEAGILTGAVSTVLAGVFAYAVKAGDVILRKAGLPGLLADDE